MEHSIKTLSDRIEQRKSDLERANTHLREMNDAVSAQINLVRKIQAEVVELGQAICVLKDANEEI